MKLRRGTATFWALLLLGVVSAVLVLVCDAGLVWNAQAELRTAADAAALAAAHGWAAQLTPEGLRGDEILSAVEQEVNRCLVQTGRDLSTTFVPNPDNEPTGDLVLGFYELTHGFVPARKQDLDSPWLNAVRITLRRDKKRGNAPGLLFGPLFGWTSAEVQASAVAVLERHVVGFQCTDGLPVPLIPLAILSDPTGQTADCWESQLAAGYRMPSTYDEKGQRVVTVRIRLPVQSAQASASLTRNGSTGPGRVDRIEPGNACVLQLGTHSWAEVIRQTASGVLPMDLVNDEFAGRFEIDPDVGFRPVAAWPAVPSLQGQELANLLAALSGLTERKEVRIWPLFTAFLPNSTTRFSVSIGSDPPLQVAVNGFIAARILRSQLISSNGRESTGSYLELTLQPRVLITRTAITATPKRSQEDTDEAVQNPYLSQPNPYLVRIKLVE